MAAAPRRGRHLGCFAGWAGGRYLDLHILGAGAGRTLAALAYGDGWVEVLRPPPLRDGEDAYRWHGVTLSFSEPSEGMLTAGWTFLAGADVRDRHAGGRP